MRFKVATILTWTAFFALSAFAEGAVDEESAEDSELRAEMDYVEALIASNYGDFAGPVIEAAKKRWPESEAGFFAIEIRQMLSLGQFDAAEKKIAALPDRKSAKYWAARLEVANNYFSYGRKDECTQIYEEFFKTFPNPPKSIRSFFIDASYAYGQLLATDGKYAKAATRYEALLKMVHDVDWCNLACETCDIYLKLIDGTSGDPQRKKERDGYVKSATVLADALLWKIDWPLFFGRAVSMKAHIEQLRGNAVRASSIIDDYRPQLQDLHNQIVEKDPDGTQGLLRQSPLPECLYLQAKILFDEAKAEYGKKQHDDEKVKVLLFGPKMKNGKRDFSKGAFAMAQNVFLNFETSSWAPQAGDLAQAVSAFTKEKYQKDVKCKITPEQIRKVRAAQFKEAHQKFLAGQNADAINEYQAVLARFPESPESALAIENMVSAHLDLMLETADEAEKRDLRMNADAIEGYLSERFADSRDKELMTAAGDAVVRLAAKEIERKEITRGDALYKAFCTNYSRHPSAANIAVRRASELQQAKNYAGAESFWRIVTTVYTNSSVYAMAIGKISECRGALGDTQGEIEWKQRYLAAETVKIRRLQAQTQLAQVYQKLGLALLDSAETNATPEQVEAAERAGTAQIIRAVKNFQDFNAAAATAMADSATSAEDKEKYAYLREVSLFLVGECWSRMKRPEKNLATYRERAVASYEAYLAAYPNGKWAEVAYLKLGAIYTAMGNVEKSRDAFDRLSKRFPDSEAAKNAKPRLAKNLMEMGLKKEGAEIYAEMLRTDGAYTASQFLAAGEALVESRDWTLANQAYEKAIRLAGTNLLYVTARANLGLAKTAWKQGSLAEARDALDRFLGDSTMSRMAIAADANLMLAEVASQQGRTEKDAMLRDRCFGAAIAALNKVMQYKKDRPQWERDRIELSMADVLVNRMHAEETMGLKDAAQETCGKAAAKFQIFIFAHGPSEEVPFDKMEAEARENLERAYSSIVPLFAKMGADQAERVIDFGQRYLDLFPDGSARTEIENCMNKARADLPGIAK